MHLPANFTIDASNFEFPDGPTGEPVGHITGTFGITDVPLDTSVKRIYINAEQSEPGYWQGWGIELTSFETLTAIPFDLPLYEEDQSGTFLPGNTVYFTVDISFTDNTSWHLSFNNSGSGYSVVHDTTTNLGSIGTGAIPSTKIITGTVSITMPAGKTLEYASVGLSNPGVGGSWANVNVESGSWKLRTLENVSYGYFRVYADATDGTMYAKVAGPTWYGESTGTLLSVTFTAEDQTDGSSETSPHSIDKAYQGTYQGYEGSATITLTVGGMNMASIPPSQSEISMNSVFTAGGGTITYKDRTGRWDYVYSMSVKQGFIMDFTAREKHIWLGDAAEAAKGDFETMFGITLDLSNIDPDAWNLEATTDIIIGTAPYNLGYTGNPATASHAQGVHTHYALDPGTNDYETAIEYLTTTFGRPPNELTGVMNHVGTSLTSGSNWLILEDWPQEVRIVQRVDGGDPSGVSWHKPPASPSP
jgi:hypothetical protein